MNMNMKREESEYIIDYRKKIIDMVNRIEDTWILQQIHDFIINMTKEGD